MTHPRRNRAAALSAALGLVWVPMLGCASMPTVKSPPTPRAPDVEVTTFGGESFNLAAQRAKWVLVNLWGSWCAPCISSLPVISEFVAAHHDVTAIGLDVDDQDHNQLTHYLSTHRFNFLLAPVPYKKAMEFMVAIPGIPVTWLIAPDGTARLTWYGGFNGPQLDQLMHDAGYRAPP